MQPHLPFLMWPHKRETIGYVYRSMTVLSLDQEIASFKSILEFNCKIILKKLWNGINIIILLSISKMILAFALNYSVPGASQEDVLQI